MDSSKIPNVEKIKRKTIEKIPNVAKTKAELVQVTKMKSKSIKEQIQLDPEIKSKDEHLSQVQIIKKTRSNSEPLKLKASDEIQLRKSKSDNCSSMCIRKATYSNHTKVKTLSDLDHANQVNDDSRPSNAQDIVSDVKQQDVTPDSEAETPKQKGIINKITPDTQVKVEGESKHDNVGGDPGFDQLIPSDATNKINLNSKPSKASTLHSLRSVPEPNLNSSTFTTTSKQESNHYDDDISKTSSESESHCKLQALVDLVMWRHVSKSAFIFGTGTFIIISSSYAKEFNFSLISVASYLSLVYLAAMFLYKSLVIRGVTERQVLSKNKLWGEEEAIWFVKLVLPYMNESVLKLRVLFSGDPAMTMKLAVVLFMLATYGSSITIGKMIKLGFFGVFVIPKLCSYSSQITAWGNFWVCRFEDAWDSCSHKKALLFAIFSVVWNFSSVVARAWAGFMLFVAFQYYQHKQSLITKDEEPNFEMKRKSSRHQLRGTTSMSTSISIGQKKEKKN